jgi:hypothetical protein
VLRNHVMVRVGGGWDTLDSFLDKIDRDVSTHAQNWKFSLSLF